MTSAHARSWAPETAGATYELGRPDYPAEIIALLAEEAGLGPGSTLADVAAGTGKLTRVLADGTTRLVAVEPMPGMRTQLRQAVPSALIVAGTAELLPLRTASVDAVTVAQAFHWFNVDEASKELRRVLAPTGKLVLVNNAQDSSDSLSGELWNVLRHFEQLAPRPESTRGWRAHLDRLGDFTGWRHFELRHEQVLASPEELEARFTSVSFVLLLEDDHREQLTAELRRVIGDRYPVRFPLRTLVDIGERTAGRA
jgi:SAM-dependent methyltransferase